MKSCSEKDTSVIPRGAYCYELVTGDFMGLGIVVRKSCPYSRTLRGHFLEHSGYCDYLDQCVPWGETKECGINIEDERYEP